MAAAKSVTAPRKDDFQLWACAWTLAADEEGASWEAGIGDRSVQMSGTWNGATVVLQGSHDDTTWFTLTDPLGNAISMTANGLKQINELTRYVRPDVTAGTPTSVVVRVVGRK